MRNAEQSENWLESAYGTLPVGWNEDQVYKPAASGKESSAVSATLRPRKEKTPWYLRPPRADPVLLYIKDVMTRVPMKMERKPCSLIDKELPALEREARKRIQEKQREKRFQRQQRIREKKIFHELLANEEKAGPPVPFIPAEKILDPCQSASQPDGPPDETEENYPALPTAGRA
uniref:Uncharacterized protein n=1 Tax=Chromera velia CCMP2878 TaxID=1169474 RepID=A0A0G4F9D1_9ALVE|eukprot:Cvel_3002.t1-p1 / transcript=Cvel_3002.t1 / gene=Cvel_3002 / organism=Chromera_velia_CCMP2878 / gene_product=hypothetical protein / transcript_product=hypothetical protein / location=Cvel_scaffold119:102100-108568(-) / protein_length=174 / sequence_SO=supercontig / SO=protein_coding / is_pseudo=false